MKSRHHKKILERNDDSALGRIEEILAQAETVAYAIEGEPLNLNSKILFELPIDELIEQITKSEY